MAVPKAKNETAAHHAELIKELRDRRGTGNPPASWPETAVGNFFPGLEFNFQNVWKRIFKNVELLEQSGEVLAVSQGAEPRLKDLPGKFLYEVDGVKLFKIVDVPVGERAENYRERFFCLEWSNALAELHQRKGGTKETAHCVFISGVVNGVPQKTHILDLEVNRLIEPHSTLISREHTLPGEITESLCSPWQTDYVGCSCFYWASNRPDFVNITDDKQHGHNWINPSRKMQDGKPLYTLDPDNLHTHEDVLQGWENKFEFIIRGQDSRNGRLPPVLNPPPKGRATAAAGRRPRRDKS